MGNAGFLSSVAGIEGFGVFGLWGLGSLEALPGPQTTYLFKDLYTEIIFYKDQKTEETIIWNPKKEGIIGLRFTQGPPETA